MEDGRPTTETGTAATHAPAGLEVLAAEGREAPTAEEDQAILTAREEDAPGSLAPRMAAMTDTAEVTVSDRS